MDHNFMFTGEVISDPKITKNEYGISASVSVRGDKIDGLTLPNGFTECTPMINGRIKLKEEKVPFYATKGKRVVVGGNFTSDAKHPEEEVKSMFTDFKSFNMINTVGVVNFAFGSGPVSKVQVGKTGVLYTVQEKKKPVGERAKTAPTSYRFYWVWANNLTEILSVGDQLVFQGLVLKGIFPLPTDYPKYGPLTQPVFYADSISGYIKKSQ